MVGGSFPNAAGQEFLFLQTTPASGQILELSVPVHQALGVLKF